MPEIALLEPRVLNGVIQEFEGPEELRGRALMGEPERDINPTWEYDIDRPSRGALTTFNSPNGEARILDQMKVGHIQGGYAYIRDKKTFTPTAMRWLRAPGENTANAANAERTVLRELNDMRQQHMRGEEISIWSMLQGMWTYDLISGGSVTVDYQIPSAHTPSALSGNARWGQSSDNPIGNIQGWKRVVVRESGFPIVNAMMNSVTMDLFNRLPEVKDQLSDRQKDNYTREGVVPRFFGIDWIEYDGGYVNSNDAYAPYIPDNKIIFFAPGGSPAWGMKYGPSADDEAPSGHTGPFVKTWSDKDPSGRQVLMEINFMPVLYKPTQLLIATVA